MKQRLISSGIVFGIGFAIGLGATYVLLGSNDSAEAVATTPETDGSNGANTSSETKVGYDTRAKPTAPPAQVAANTRDQNANIPSDFLNEGESAEDLDVEAPTTPDTNAPPTTDTGAESPSQPDGHEQTPPENKTDDESPQDTNWWEGLTGKQCVVDLGNARALTIRKGKITDGQVADWATDFGRLSRIGLMNALDKNVVTVHGVAINALGTPIAAEISLDKQGKITRGVIALHTQGLRVTLRPLGR